ncbi:MAG: response regulator transcription factor [Betaproteobacteria bacterium]|nr:response regulator transcription factor [Betaproteobacteria bacterium]
MRILIIEDDPAIAANLYDFLEAQGHVVDAAADGVTGLHLAVTGQFDAIVLDLGLPGMDGVTVCRKLRDDAHDDTPVLMLTARDTLDDKLEGFARGADDYLVKPFALKEVEARLTALHKRRAGRVTSRALAAGDLTFDPASLTTCFRGKDVRLPPKCIRLLQVLMTQPNRVFSRQELETEVWGQEQETSDTLRSHMHVLRRELAQAGGYDPIENVHGLGYRLVPRGGD